MKSSAPVAKYLLEFKKKYKKKGKKVVEILVQKLEAGEDVEQAIRETIEVTHFQDMLDQDTKNAIAASMAAGMGRTSIPLLPEMETPWDPSELTLSEKLHSIHREIHQKIGNIVQQQVRLHNHASDIRKALYDGYNGQKTEAVLQQELPQYIKGAVDFIRRTPFEKTDKDCRLRLIRRIERQAKALTSKPLKTAYKELAIQLGKNNEDGLKRAVYVAVQEKSRYVAERIARTESARAWADGFIARYETDDTVAAYRWEVSSAHPCTDVCDMYANADLWGLGTGIYPKDQCPTLPAHPHCLCYLSPIYEGEVDLNEQQDLREEGGNHWLQKQSKDVQRQLLGVQGAKAWEAGRPWQDVLRNYSPAVMKSRVKYLPIDRSMLYYKQMKEVEPTISKVIQEVAKATETKLAGFECRIKEIDSYQRKIKEHFDLGDENYRAKDIVRYTYLAEADNLVDKIKEIRQKLEDKGYKTVEVKNYWLDKTNPYNGINTIVRIPIGEEIEIQYHTLESLETKEQQHKIYKAQRELSPFSIEYIELKYKMFDIAKDLEPPKNIENIEE